MLGDFLKIGEAAIGAAAKEGDIDLDADRRGSGGELHVLDGFMGGGTVFLGEFIGVGYCLVDEDRLSGSDAPGDGREDLLGLEVDDVVVDGVLVRGNGLPACNGRIPLRSLRRVGAPAQVLKGGFVRIHIADTGSSLDRHIADGHALFLGEVIEGRSTVFVGVADTAIHPEVADDMKNDILGVDAGGELAVDINAADLGLADCHGLGGKHVADLTCSNAEGNGAEGSVSGGMGVTAGDRGAGLGDTLLGADDVDNALIARGKVEECNAGLGAVFSEFLHHRVGERIGEGFRTLVGRNNMIDSGEGAVRVEDFQAKISHHPEGLRACHLMNEVSADQKLSPAVGERANGVFLPDLIEKRFGHSHSNLA